MMAISFSKNTGIAFAIGACSLSFKTMISCRWVATWAAIMISTLTINCAFYAKYTLT